MLVNTLALNSIRKKKIWIIHFWNSQNMIVTVNIKGKVKKIHWFLKATIQMEPIKDSE